MSKGKLFISYKTGKDNGLSFTAKVLRDKLQDEGYEIFLDHQNLIAGSRWDDQIFFEQIPIQDVVLLLLSEPVKESKAIQREIEIASRVGVSIVPVLIRGDFDVNEVLNVLGMDNVQYVEFKSAEDHEYKKLTEQIDVNIDHTRKKREENLIKLAKQGEEKTEKKEKFTPDSQHYRAYTLPDISAEKCKVYL
ncbi:MAG: toll/interleukin-1 receptor domain-containing protein, partial [Anaerolineae bacterium]|nr:toll/interleukin-1 receptor domain-containing protein [Anaerolineae bacterium]